MKKRIVSVIVLTAMTMPVAFPLANNYIGESISVASEAVEREEYVSMYNPTPPSEAKDTDIVNIPDEGLKSVIEKQLGREYGNADNTEITVGDMKKLYYLSGLVNIGGHIIERNISSLEGLQYATNLKDLYITQARDKDIEDNTSETGFLKPISNIPNLEKLRIKSSNITSPDLKYLNTNLEELRINKSKITDISYLSGLESLRSLELSGNYIKNAEPLKKLTKLQALIINDNQIEDISFLGELKSLHKLDISNNILESKRIDEGMDISILSKLDRLIELSAESNGINDISSLTDLKLLNKVELSNNRISNIEVLKDSNPLTEWYFGIQNVQLILEDENNTFESPIIDINGQRAKLSEYGGFKSLGNGLYEADGVRPSGTWTLSTDNINCSGLLEVINKNALEEKILKAKGNPTEANIDEALQSLKNLQNADAPSEFKEWIKNSIEELESLEIQPEKIYPYALGFDYWEKSILTGEEIQLKLNIYPENATEREIEWSSSDKDVVSVDASGNIEALAAGDSIITAKVKGSDIKTEATITVKDPVINAESIELNKEKIELETDKTEKLTATVKPSNATSKDIEWSSSDKDVVSVDASGNIKGLSEGKAIITAKVKGSDIKTEATITVKDPVIYADSVELDKAKIELETGKTEKLTATVKPGNATNKDVEWSSSDKDVVSVDALGNVKGLSEGAAIVTAKIKDTNIKTVALITVKDPVINAESIELNKVKIELETGKIEKLTATVKPSNATKKEVEWSSSDKDVVSVDASGNIKGLSEGKAIITAKVKGTDISNKTEITVKKGKEAVPVTDVKAKSIRLNTSSAELKKDDTYQLRATVNPNSSTQKDIEWTSANSSVATVDSNGLVKAVGEGTATIRARVKGSEILTTATITVKKVEIPKVKAESIELNASKVDMQVEQKEKLIAIVKPDKAENKEVEWSSSDENVVKVDTEGNIEAVGTGTAKVTAKVKGTDITAEAEIFVTEKASDVDSATEFTDINSHWAKESIENAFARGLFKGITETLFSPETNMTRGMFVTVLGRLAGETAEPNDKFSDVNSEAYYAEYIAWAEENEIVEGYGNGKFGPDNNVTREEMAAIIQRYMDYMGIELEDNDTEEFRDAGDISDWAKESVIKIQKAGIIEGKGNGVFDPQANSTRAEVATLLIRTIEKYID